MASLPFLLWNLLGASVIGFGLVGWWRSGRKFPGFIHRLAFALGWVGTFAALALAFTGGLDRGALAACLLVPAVAPYLGWLWLGGPLLTEADTGSLTPRAGGRLPAD